MSHHDPYDQGQSQGDMGAYNNYEAQAGSQNSYYQNSYGSTAPFASPPAVGYNQGFAKIEGALENLRLNKRSSKDREAFLYQHHFAS